MLTVEGALCSTTFYKVTGSVGGTLVNPPSGSATLELEF
jgi:hypothetical protein